MEKLQACPQQAFDFLVAGTGMLMADAFAREIAGEFVQVESDGDALFAGHLAVTFDLDFSGCLRTHRVHTIPKAGESR